MEIALDRLKPVTADYETYGRSEEWKENVLRNQAIRRVSFAVKGKKPHRLKVKALTPGVVVDQVKLTAKN